MASDLGRPALRASSRRLQSPVTLILGTRLFRTSTAAISGQDISASIDWQGSERTNIDQHNDNAPPFGGALEKLWNVVYLGPARTRGRPRAGAHASHEPCASKGAPFGHEPRVASVRRRRPGARHELHQATGARPAAIGDPRPQARFAASDRKLDVERYAVVQRGAPDARHRSSVGALVHRDAFEARAVMAPRVGGRNGRNGADREHGKHDGKRGSNALDSFADSPVTP